MWCIFPVYYSAFCEGQADFVHLIPLLKILLVFVDADSFTLHITHASIYRIMIVTGEQLLKNEKLVTQLCPS